MNALMRLNQLKPGLQYKLVSQTGPVHAPIFTMSVEVDGSSFEASGPSKKTAKLHVAVKVPSSCGKHSLHFGLFLCVDSMYLEGHEHAEVVRFSNTCQVTCGKHL